MNSIQRKAVKTGTVLNGGCFTNGCIGNKLNMVLPSALLNRKFKGSKFKSDRGKFFL